MPMFYFSKLLLRRIFSSLSVLMAFSLLYACYTQNDSISTKEYSGEEIFKAVFFLQGDALSKISSLQEPREQLKVMMATSKEAEKSSVDFANAIIKSINRIDPTYFDSFKKQIQSDNYYSIQLALANGTKMVRIAGLSSPEYGGIFKLTEKLESKNLDPKDFENLDPNKEEDLKKLKSVLKDKYSINMDDEQYKVACTPPVAICVAFTIAAVVAATVAAVITSVWGLATLWTKAVERVGTNPGANPLVRDFSKNNYLIADLAQQF